MLSNITDFDEGFRENFSINFLSYEQLNFFKEYLDTMNCNGYNFPLQDFFYTNL